MKAMVEEAVDKDLLKTFHAHLIQTCWNLICDDLAYVFIIIHLSKPTFSCPASLASSAAAKVDSFTKPNRRIPWSFLTKKPKLKAQVGCIYSRLCRFTAPQSRFLSKIKEASQSALSVPFVACFNQSSFCL